MNTESYKTFFKGKKITVMGLGLLGRGVGDVAFLASLGAKLTVTDMKTREQLAPSLKKLAKYKNIRFVLGEHRVEDFTDADMVIKAAGVPLDSIYIQAAQAAGIPVRMTTELFAQFARERGGVIAGITGTRGKSTTTHLLYHILKVAKKHVLLGGNVRGVATLPQLPQVKRGTIAVLELDSWQLQGFGEQHISPSVSVFTSFMQDHLNYYPSMDRYFTDKSYIYSGQHKEDVLIAGPTAASRIKKDFKNVHGKFIAVRAGDVPQGWKRQLLGEHNTENIACAIAAARALGISEAVIKKAVASFAPVEGRLQLLRSVRGVAIINDNNGTTPDATIAALNALPKKGGLVLIMGGSDKGISFKSLIAELKKRKAQVVLLPGTGSDRFRKEYTRAPMPVSSMKEAVAEAMRLVKKGDTVLLSPGCASFGLFKNEYDRNDQFVAAVKKL